MTSLRPQSCSLCSGEPIDYCIACRRDLCHRHALTHEQDPEKGLCRDLWPGP